MPADRPPPPAPPPPPLQPLSVELGPGILGNIFDGIQRPLKAIALESGDCFIPRGVAVPALNASKLWEFNPTGFKASSPATGPWPAAEAPTGRAAPAPPRPARRRPRRGRA
jgi:hypothetical protein